MNRQEIADLFELVVAAYPKAFIKDVGALLAVWEMAFGEEPAEKVYRAARHHIKTSKEFPTVAHICEAMNKGELIYGPRPEVNQQRKLEAPKAPHKKIKAEDECSSCWMFNDICDGLSNGKCNMEGI